MHVKTVSSKEDIDVCFSIRKTVFCQEQNVAVEREIDGKDSEAVHFLACINDMPAGTARMRFVTYGQETHTVAKLERIAVLKEFRDKSVGVALVKKMIHYAHKQGYIECVLESQVSVIPFYEKFGFVEEGDTFYDANILHKAMRRR